MRIEGDIKPRSISACIRLRDNTWIALPAKPALGARGMPRRPPRPPTGTLGRLGPFVPIDREGLSLSLNVGLSGACS
jgi:hypothetical protein